MNERFIKPGDRVVIANNERYPRPRRGEDIGDLEQEVQGDITDKIMGAISQSADHRRRFDRLFDRYFGEVDTSGDADENAGMYAPFIGRNIRVAVDMMVAELFPNQQDADYVEIVPAEITTPEQQAALREAAVALEAMMREALLRGDYVEKVKRAIIQFLITGNALAMVKWVDDIEIRPKSIDEAVQDLTFDEIMGFVEVEDSEISVEGSRPELAVMDMRNVFVPNLYIDGGIKDCPYLGFYDTITYHEMRENQIRDDGSGCYANVDKFQASEAGAYPQIYDNDYEDGWNYDFSDGGSSYTPCFQLFRYVGPIRWADYMRDRIGAAQVNALLRKFGNIPKDTVFAKWWLVEIVEGKIVQLRPYPYFSAQRCPFIAPRLYFRPGRTYGEGMYRHNTALEEIANCGLRNAQVITQLNAHPPVQVNKEAFDPQWWNKKNGRMVLYPGEMIRMKPGMNLSDAFRPMDFKSDVVPLAMNMYRESSAIIDDILGITAVTRGQNAGAPTAAQTQMLLNGSMSSIRSAMLTIEDELVKDSIQQQLELLLMSIRMGDGTVSVSVSSERGVSKLGAIAKEIGAPVVLDLARQSFRSKFLARVVGTSLSGGRARKIAALENAMKMAETLKGTATIQFDTGKMALDYLSMSGLVSPEKYIMSPGEQQQLDARIMEQQVIQDGMTAQGIGKAKGSPPRQRESNPAQMAEMMG